MARVKHKEVRADSGLFDSWEFHERVVLEVNGKNIRVSEWRKEFKDGNAVIRLGYLRIDNSPRFQIIILFNGVRVMADRPPFRNFDDALDAANLWLDYGANRMQSQSRRLSAIPAPASVLQIPAPVTVRPTYKKLNQVQEPAQETVKVKRLKPAEMDIVIREEYYKLDHGMTSLLELRKAVSHRIRYEISLALIQKRMGSNGLPMLQDKLAAITIARPIVKKRMARIIKENPNVGFKRCYDILEKTKLAGYKKKWVQGIYDEARKESGLVVNSNQWLVK